MEYKGLKAQYLFIFAGGLIADFVLFVVMYMCGIPQWFCISFGVVSASVLVWYTFHLNGKYGQYGLMKLTSVNYRMDYMTLKEASEKWGVTPRRINYYCVAGRIPGALKVATIWLLPKDAAKPIDGRTKQGRALKHE